MKTIIISLICSLTFIQQQEPLSSLVNIKPPRNNERLSKSQYSLLIKKRFGKNRTIDEDVKNIYEIDGMILTFKDMILDNDYSKSNAKSLPQIKDEMVEMMKHLHLKNNLDKAEIVKINNIDFFLFKTHLGDNYSYHFTSETRNYKYIIGSIEFEKQDKERADKIFDDLIKSISFKK